MSNFLSSKRIAIFGCAGSGKSTLAIDIHKKTDIPLYYLDHIYWKPAWIRQDFKEFKKKHDELCTKDSWIIDGSSTQTLAYRLERADLIIFLDMSRWLCMYQVLKRLIFNYGKIRKSSAEGCPERFDIQFLKWIWNYQKQVRPRILALLTSEFHNKKIYRLKSHKEIHNFLKNNKG